MQSLDDLKKKFDADVARVNAEHALANLAPVMPRMVQINPSLPNWLSYSAPTLWEALDIVRKFQPVEFRQYKKTFTRFTPPAFNIGRDAGEEVGGPFAVEIDVSQGEGFGPCVTLGFYALVGDTVCKIRVALEREGYGPSAWWQYGAAFSAHDRGRSRRLDGQRLIAGDFRANNSLSAMLDTSIKWGTGDERSAHFAYYLVADMEPDAEGGAIEWTHAEGQLINLAREFHGEPGK